MENQTEKSHEEQVKELSKLIADIKFGMFTTVQTDGSLRSRPMAAQQIEGDGNLWFFTYDNDPKCDEVNRDHHVNISFSEPKDNKYVSISGKAEVVKDRPKMEELWTPIYKAWFPKGLEEPHIGLLKVKADKAEYWNSPNNAIVKAIAFTKAVLTGKMADNVGTHERVQTDPLVGEKKDIHS